jgi:hypothetical protein
MLPRCRTADEPFVIPPFDVQVSDVEGFMDELQEFQSLSMTVLLGVKPGHISWIPWSGNTAPWPGNLLSRWRLRLRGVVSAACNAFSVRPYGMRSRCGGTTTNLWRTNWASPRAS